MGFQEDELRSDLSRRALPVNVAGMYVRAGISLPPFPPDYAAKGGFQMLTPKVALGDTSQVVNPTGQIDSGIVEGTRTKSALSFLNHIDGGLEK